MPESLLDLPMRPATLDDARIVADLDTARDPDDPRDPVLMRHWWTTTHMGDRVNRQISVDSGVAVAFVAAGHAPWKPQGERYGWIRPALLPARWSEESFAGLVRSGEKWLREEGAQIAVVRKREHLARELKVLHSLGYAETRRQRVSVLDLDQARDRIREQARAAIEEMTREGVSLLTLEQWPDPEKLVKLYALVGEIERDIPTTVPWQTPPFEEWLHEWFDSPAMRQDRFWIAVEHGEAVGLSVLEFPVERGEPWTALTGTARSVRGRGIGRALKYQSMEQAIELGFHRVSTQNDAENAPILRINAEMGYRPARPYVELHRRL